MEADIERETERVCRVISIKMGCFLCWWGRHYDGVVKGAWWVTFHYGGVEKVAWWITFQERQLVYSLLLEGHICYPYHYRTQSITVC